MQGYECTECQKQFAKWSTMAKHCRSVHGTIIEEEIKATKRETEPLNKMECDKCGKVFHKRHRMMGHLRTHRGLKVNGFTLISHEFANILFSFS